MFGEKYNEYESVRLGLGLSKHTLDGERMYHGYFWAFLEDSDFVGDETQVRPAQIQDYAFAVNSFEHMKPSSKRQRLERLKSFYNYAVKVGWMIQHPFDGLKLPKNNDSLPRVLSVKDIKLLIETPDIKTVKGIRDRTMMELLYSSAIRGRELLSVTANDFSEDYRSLRLIGKGKDEHVIPVGKMAAHFLSYYVGNIWQAKAKCDELFFSLKTGKALTRSALKNMVRRYGIKAGFAKSVSPHVFRYSAATHLADEGVDIRLIQAYLRHKNIDMTAKYVEQGIKGLKRVHGSTHPRERA